MSHRLLDSGPAGPRRALRRGVVALLAGVLVLTGCGGDDDSGGDGGSDALADLPEVAASEYEDMTGQDTVTIDTRDNTFGPQYVTVSPGTEVVWANRGRNPHNVVPVEEGSFDEIPTDELSPGSEVSVTFDDAGEFPYYCSLHATPTAGMTGRIRVAEE